MRLKPVRQIRLPLCQRVPHRYVLRIRELLFAGNKIQPARFSLPVARPNVLERHRSRFPLIRRAHIQRRVVAVRLDRIQHAEEFLLRLRRGQVQFLEDVLVVDEPVNHRGHRHAEHRAVVVCNPGALGYVSKVLHPRQIVQRSQVAAVIQRQAGVKRAAGDQVAGGAPFQLGVQRRVVFRRGARREDHFNVGVLLVKRGDDDVLPDGHIIIPPALYGQRHFLPGCRRGGLFGGSGARFIPGVQTALDLFSGFLRS